MRRISTASYGSDMPGRSFATQLAKVYGAQISDAEKQHLVSGNLIRLMRPLLEAKGIAVDRP